MSLILRLKPLPLLERSLKSLQKVSRQRICSAPARWSMEKTRLRPSDKKLKSLMTKDNVSGEYDLIYRAPMENYVSATNAVSTVTATLIAGLAVFNHLQDSAIIMPPRELNLFGLVSDQSDIWWFAAGFILINLAIRVFVVKYPLRIYKSPQNYLAVYDSQLPFITTKHSFLQGQVAPVRNIFNPWHHTMYRLGSRSSMLLLDYFRTPSEFHHMCAPKKSET